MSSSGIAVRAEGLGKRYALGTRAPYRTIRELLAGGEGGARPPQDAWVWALKDASFEIRAGEAVGIVGCNGAGKSTLLRILSRVTSPTEGTAEVRGRLRSLLEIGTGFHPELSGRENIYLNGAVLGMTRKEITGQFEAIASFAGIDAHLDTPVKHYSSGMYMRLGFSVAAHLSADILVVDEVLAVGDAAFQKKCLGRMDSLAQEGRTLLFVSHQMNAIRRLCSRCLWLDAGRVRMDGKAASVIDAYESDRRAPAGSGAPRKDVPRGGPARFLSWEFVSPAGADPHAISTTGPATLRVLLSVERAIRHGSIGIALHNDQRHLIWAWAEPSLSMDPGTVACHYTLPSLPLRPGPYSLLVSLYEDGAEVDLWECTPLLQVQTPPLTHPSDQWSGILNLPCEFRIVRI